MKVYGNVNCSRHLYSYKKICNSISFKLWPIFIIALIYKIPRIELKNQLHISTVDEKLADTLRHL